MDIVQIYLQKRLAELTSMIEVYDEAAVDPPVDLLARRHELMRLRKTLADYVEVEAENGKN